MLGFGWGDATAVVVDVSVVEPVDPFQRGQREVVETPPRAVFGTSSVFQSVSRYVSAR